MTTFQTTGNVDIKLPSYMKMIQPTGSEEVDFYAYGPIVACGLRPGTKELIMMDPDNQLYELNAESFFQTEDIGYDAFPTEGGQIVVFVRDEMIITVDSIDLLEASSKIQLTNLSIGMMHEDQVINIT